MGVLFVIGELVLRGSYFCCPLLYFPLSGGYLVHPFLRGYLVLYPCLESVAPGPLVGVFRCFESCVVLAVPVVPFVYLLRISPRLGLIPSLFLILFPFLGVDQEPSGCRSCSPSMVSVEALGSSWLPSLWQMF